LTDQVISEEEEQRILTSDGFYDFLQRSSKIIERTLDEDYDVLVDYTVDVEANQYVILCAN
jgi:dynein intermediate chain, cytosolic